MRLSKDELQSLLKRGNVTVEGGPVVGLPAATAAEFINHSRVVSGDIVLVLPYPPSANRYWRSWRGKVVISEEAREYKKRVARIALNQGFNPIVGPVVVRSDVFRPQKRGDLDNTMKVVLDALRGIAYEDDSQVVEIHLFRNDDKMNPRAEITISPWKSK